MLKVYRVTFMTYTNALKTTVSNGEFMIDKYKSIELGHEPFLITEDQIEYYNQFGGGIRNMEFVGYMEKGGIRCRS